MGGGGSSGQTTTTASNAPWASQQPYLQQGMQSAQDLYNNNTPQYYPNSTNAPMNDMQSGALTAQYNRGMGGSALDGAANTYNTAILDGAFLGAGNPYFQAQAQNVANTVIPQVQSGFEATGRYGSGAAANATASALANAEGNFAYQNYNNERMNQQQALALAPSTSSQDYTNIGNALSAGNTLQAQQQNALNADVNKFNYYQQLPYQKLAAYQSAIGGNYGSQASQSTPYYSNTAAGALGGTLSGAVMGSAIMPGWGTAIGAGLGLIGGLMK